MRFNPISYSVHQVVYFALVLKFLQFVQKLGFVPEGSTIFDLHSSLLDEVDIDFSNKLHLFFGKESIVSLLVICELERMVRIVLH